MVSIASLFGGELQPVANVKPWEAPSSAVCLTSYPLACSAYLARDSFSKIETRPVPEIMQQPCTAEKACTAERIRQSNSDQTPAKHVG